MYKKCPFKTFYGLCNIFNIPKDSKLQLQTWPTFTAMALLCTIDCCLGLYVSKEICGGMEGPRPQLLSVSCASPCVGVEVLKFSRLLNYCKGRKRF